MRAGEKKRAGTTDEKTELKGKYSRIYNRSTYIYLSNIRKGE